MSLSDTTALVRFILEGAAGAAAGAAFFCHGWQPDLSMTGCPFSVIDTGKLLQYKLIHLHYTKKKYPSTGIPCTPVRVFDLKNLFLKRFNPYTYEDC
jgi:hypothetical protein